MNEDEFFSAAQTAAVRAPLPLLPQCGACKLDKGCKNPRIPVSGQGQKRVLIVSEFPGEKEDEQNAALVGGTGRFVSSKLHELGVNMRRDCWLTNALLCKPGPNPKAKSVEYCRPALLKTVRELNPEVIILMGDFAIKSLVGYLWKPTVGSEDRWVGWQIPSVKLNAWVCPTCQPARLFHKNDPTREVRELYFDAHLRAAVDLIGTRPWPDGPPDYESRVECVMNAREAVEFLRSIDSGAIAFDYETNMLKPQHANAEIVCASVCHNGERTVAFPWSAAVKAELSRVLTDPGIAKIAANAKFEDLWTRYKLGVEVVGWSFDTMLAAHLLNPRGGKDDKGKNKEESGITGLKLQAFVKLGVGDYSSHIEPFFQSVDRGGYSPNRIRQVPMRQLLLYCGLDSLLEWELAQRQMDELGL